MVKLRKALARTVGIMAIIGLICGLCVAILTWVIAGKAPTSVDIHHSKSVLRDGNEISFSYFWWGGTWFIIPGILGIIAGFTRNRVVMIFYLIFNILCLLASLAMAVFLALLIGSWAVVAEALSSSTADCVTVNLVDTKCVCSDFQGTSVILNGVTCDSMLGTGTLLSVLIILGAISFLLASISAYFSCCSMCNQEQLPIVIIQPQPAKIGGDINAQQQVMSNPLHQTDIGYPPHQQHIGNSEPPAYSNNSSKDDVKLTQTEVI